MQKTGFLHDDGTGTIIAHLRNGSDWARAACPL
jgi:hypothetical protein